ncbi:MAG: NADH-quinone oxidoreductase subunit N [Bdellovibrio sp.]|nr:NADH-quinone oxidoreductase subunit N [Bdellovibrio sp.]
MNMANMMSFIKPELLVFNDLILKSSAPYLWVLLGIVFAIILSVLNKINKKWFVFIFMLIFACLGVRSAFRLMNEPAVLLFNQMLISDSFGSFFNILFLGSAIITALSSFRYLDKQEIQHPEYYILLLLSSLGMMLMASALDLIVLFIALEIMSLAVYVLVGFRRHDRKSNEAALKYFILGSVASVMFLYGAALLYGVTATTQIREILKHVQTSQGAMSPLFVVGVGLILFGFLFKVACVPLHMWMPDVYEGAPTPITGFMTAGLKAAAFAAFIRVFTTLGYGTALSAQLQNHFHDLLWVFAVATMVVGNLVALLQTNLKRMLAYSSIAHSGYLLVGILSGCLNQEGYAPLLVYLMAYVVMNLGAFAVLSFLASRDDTGLSLYDLSGLSKRHPVFSFCLAVFLFSMAGLPPTVGFVGKYWLFYSAVQAGEISLVVISVLCSAVSVYYYLRVLVYVYMQDEVSSFGEQRSLSIFYHFAVGLMVICTLQWGLMPSSLLQIAKKVVMSF